MNETNLVRNKWRHLSPKQKHFFFSNSLVARDVLILKFAPDIYLCCAFFSLAKISHSFYADLFFFFSAYLHGNSLHHREATRDLFLFLFLFLSILKCHKNLSPESIGIANSRFFFFSSFFFCLFLHSWWPHKRDGGRKKASTSLVLDFGVRPHTHFPKSPRKKKKWILKRKISRIIRGPYGISLGEFRSHWPILFIRLDQISFHIEFLGLYIIFVF